MSRPLACIALLVAVSTSIARAESGRRDPLFSELPVEQWLAEGERPSSDWSAEILPAEISTHQRLMLRVVIRVEGSYLDKRRGAGEFVTLVKYKDRNADIWQNHTSLDLTKLPPGIGTHQTAIAQYAFVLPGDYSLDIAVCDTATLEHSQIFRKVHAEPLKDDPLPDAWTGLPAVEFIPAVTEPPDVWYLPGIEHRLNLNLTTQRPVHVHLLVNTTPSPAASLARMRANMSAVIPALKVISQLDVRSGSLDAAFLDLTRRRVIFEQKNLHSLAWDGIREIFLNAQPGLIDFRDLAKQSNIREFFRSEVSRRLEVDGDAIPVVIILSGPASLPDREPLTPRDSDRRLFYIRFVTYPSSPPPPLVRSRRGAAPTTPTRVPVDDLEHAAEPLGATLYEATTVEEFRRILAAVFDQISRIQ